MKNQNYEKPQMKFVLLRSEEAVANPCWGNHNKPNQMVWYDTEGQGYVSFMAGGSSCTLEAINVYYYTEKGDTTGDLLEKTDPLYKKMVDLLKTSGGESGNPFKGEGFSMGPEPPEEWS